MMTNDFHQRCVLCDIVPDARQLFQCPNKHVMCIMCGLKSGRTCKLDHADMTVISNPMNPTPDDGSVVNAKVCPHIRNGCQWGFRTSVEAQEHAKECKFRPYTCIGNVFKVWNCDWKGTQEQFEEHANQAHPHLREHFKYWHSGTVPFSTRQTIRMLKLIDAFNKKFVFFYNSNGESDELTFSIFLLGRKCDADRYLIDFEVRNDQRKMKFLEKCHPDSDDLFESIRTGHAFTMPKKTIESLVDNEEINYRFIIKRKDVVATENVIKEEYLKKHILANAPTQTMEPAAVNAKEPKVNAMKDIKSIWNDNAAPIAVMPSTSNLKAEAKKVFDQSPQEFFSDVPSGREYEAIGAPGEIAGRPRKMDVSALADVVQSFNLKRGTSINEGRPSQQQQQPPQMPSNPFNQRFGAKLIKKKFPMKPNGLAPNGFIRN